MNIISEIIYAIVLWLSTFLPHQQIELYPSLSFEYQTKRYGTVFGQVYEGCERNEDDIYIIELQDGTLVDIVADDLQTGDDVTIYYNNGSIIWTLYGKR